MGIVIRDVDVENLTEIEMINYICEKTGYEYVSEFPIAQKGAQAKLYKVRKNGTEYVLKYFINISAGGCGGGYRDGETFLINEYLKEVEKINKDFKIERALASDEELKSHPNIARTIIADDVTFTEGNVKLTEWFIIMKKYQPLSLDARSIPNIREEREALRLGVQICNALITLHGRKDLFNEASKSGGLKGILHGDIKPENILFEKTEKGTYNYVLADFGLSKTKGTVSSDSSVRGGTVWFMCPEYVDGYYSTRADLYALCATLYLLLNEGPFSQARPRERVVSDVTGNRFLLGFTGRMPEPKNASKEMKELLVNALEYKSADRNCKSARELKAKLQEIQFKHAKEAYNQGDIQKCEAYISDLKEYKPDDEHLLESIRELEIKLSLANLCDAERTGTANAAASLKQEKQTLYKCKTAKIDKRAGEVEDIYYPKGQQIAKLVFVSILILATMGGNLIASLSAEFDFLHAILSGGTSVILAVLLSLLCRKVLRGLTYGSIAVDLVLIFLLANVGYTCICIATLDTTIIWPVIGGFTWFVIATFMIVMIITVCEDIWISPNFLANYIPAVIPTTIGAFISILGCIEAGISAFSEDVYLTGALALVGGVATIGMKLGFDKEIKTKSSENRKVNSLKRYDVVTFGDDTKVVVLEKCKYKGDNYVFVNDVLPDESDVTDVYKIMKIHPEDNTLEAVWEPAILLHLGVIFEKKLKRYV